jgi:homoserine acetyltransferase
MTAYDWGWPVESIAERLMQLSGKARENGERYANLTAQNAAFAVDARQQRGRG